MRGREHPPRSRSFQTAQQATGGAEQNGMEERIGAVKETQLINIRLRSQRACAHEPARPHRVGVRFVVD